MNILEEIQNCPVEWKDLGEVCELKNGYTPSKANKEFWENGTIPWFRLEDIRKNGRILSNSLQHVSKAAVKGGKVFTANSIIVSTTATIGEIALITVPFLCNQQITAVMKKQKYEKDLDIKFLFYYLHILSSDMKKGISGGSFPIVSLSKMKSFKIPVPPREIQEKIVQTLDKMTEYATELTSELTSRKKQYSFYRDKLLSFEDEVYPVEWKELGEVVKYTRGKGLSKKDKETGNFPIILYGELYTVYGNYIKRIVSFSSEDVKDKSVRIRAGDIVLPISSTTKEAQIGKGSVLCVDEVFLGGDAISLSPLDFVLSSYLMYVINGGNFEKEKMNCVRGTTIQHLNPDRLLKIKIPIPPLEIQEKIVQILDNFDTVCNDLSIGLPKEIELRQKQYEYWREQLLNFNK